MGREHERARQKINKVFFLFLSARIVFSQSVALLSCNCLVISISVMVLLYLNCFVLFWPFVR